MTMTMTATAERLTPVERDAWEMAGYFIVKGALSTELADQLHDTVMQRCRSAGPPAGPVVSERQLWRVAREFRNLMTAPKVIGRVIDLIGEDIQLMSAEYIVRFRDESEHLWHTDGAETSDGFGGYPRAIRPGSLMQLKVGYALHDLLTDESGVTRVAPGSHRLENARINRYRKAGDDPPGATSVVLRKGDAMLFHQGIWHSGGVVGCDTPRVMLFYGYNYLFCRPFDYETIDLADLGPCTAVQRRLLAPFDPALVRPSRFYGRGSSSLRELLGMDESS